MQDIITKLLFILGRSSDYRGVGEPRDRNGNDGADPRGLKNCSVLTGYVTPDMSCVCVPSLIMCDVQIICTRK
jgi:hypothetical protein